MMPKRRLRSSNSKNLNVYDVDNDKTECVSVSKNSKVLTHHSLRSLDLRKTRATNTSQKRKLELGQPQNKAANACSKKVKEATDLTEVADLHSVTAFHRDERMESVRDHVIHDRENDLDAVIETVMYEDYKNRKKSSSFYHQCYREPQHCHSVHGKHVEICHPLQRILNGYCNQTLWTCAVEYINMFLIGYEYPSPTVILHLLDFILNSHELAAVVKTIRTISHFVGTHPPYAPEMRQYYIDLLTTGSENAFAKIKRNGFLYSIISLLKEVEDDAVPKKFSTVRLSTNAAVEEESTEADRYNYETLSKQQKLQRLMWLLDWIAHAFEIDFINFLAKHEDNPSEYIIKEETKPLILATLWKGASMEDTAEHSECCIISLIEVWIRANVLILPLSFQQSVMKIIKLIAECAFLCDFSLGPYPNYGPHCEAIAQHIAHALSGLKTEDILHAIHAIDPEWLGFRVAYLMTCKEVEWIPSERITIENLVDLCYHVLGGTAEEDPNEQEVGRPSLAVQNEAGRLCAGRGTQNNTDRNELGDTMLKRACSLNDTKLVLKLLRQPGVDITVTESDGWTVLHEAVLKASVQCVRALLSHKPKEGKKPVNIHAKNNEGITPLMCAVMGNKLEVTKLLLRYGGISILHDKNSQGETAIDLATSAEMQKLLHNYATKFSSNVRVSCLAISLAKLLIPFYISVYRIQHICKPQFQKTVKHSPLTVDLILFKREIADVKKLKYALENLPYLTEYEYLISALSTGMEEPGD